MTEHDKWADIRRRLPCRVCGKERVVGSRNGGLVCPDLDCPSGIEYLGSKERTRILGYYRSLQKEQQKPQVEKGDVYLRHLKGDTNG